MFILTLASISNVALSHLDRVRVDVSIVKRTKSHVLRIYPPTGEFAHTKEPGVLFQHLNMYNLRYLGAASSFLTKFEPNYTCACTCACTGLVPGKGQPQAYHAYVQLGQDNPLSLAPHDHSYYIHFHNPQTFLTQKINIRPVTQCSPKTSILHRV